MHHVSLLKVTDGLFMSKLCVAIRKGRDIRAKMGFFRQPYETLRFDGLKRLCFPTAIVLALATSKEEA